MAVMLENSPPARLKKKRNNIHSKTNFRNIKPIKYVGNLDKYILSSVSENAQLNDQD